MILISLSLMSRIMDTSALMMSICLLSFLTGLDGGFSWFVSSVENLHIVRVEMHIHRVLVLQCVLVYRGLRDFGEFSVGSDVVVLLIVEARTSLDHGQFANLRLPKW